MRDLLSGLRLVTRGHQRIRSDSMLEFDADLAVTIVHTVTVTITNGFHLQNYPFDQPKNAPVWANVLGASQHFIQLTSPISR